MNATLAATFLGNVSSNCRTREDLSVNVTRVPSLISSRRAKKAWRTRKVSREYPPPRTPSSGTSPALKKRAALVVEELVRKSASGETEPAPSAFRFSFDGAA